MILSSKQRETDSAYVFSSRHASVILPSCLLLGSYYFKMFNFIAHSHSPKYAMNVTALKLYLVYTFVIFHA